ncbi:uncharacterized protein LOC144954529 [Lampetra fluviatilis]
MDLDASSGGAENSDESNAQTPLSPLRVFVESTLAGGGGGAGGGAAGGAGGGGRVLLMVEPGESVMGLRAMVAMALRLPRTSGGTDFHLLLDRTRLLDGRGSVHEAGLRNGCTLTVVPALKSGLKAARPKAENSILQALQSLTDSQVSDFLCGRSPLTLTLTNLAGSLSLVQLQLATRPTRGGGRHSGGHGGGQAGGQAGGHVTSEEATQASCSGASLESLHQLYPGCFSGIFSGSLPPSLCVRRRSGGISSGSSSISGSSSSSSSSGSGSGSSSSSISGSSISGSSSGGRPRQEDVAVVYRILLDLLAASRAQRSHNNNNSNHSHNHSNNNSHNNNNNSHNNDSDRIPRASSNAACDGSRAAETQRGSARCRGDRAAATVAAATVAAGESPPESPRYDARCYAAA